MSRRSAREAALLTLFQLEFDADKACEERVSDLAIDEVDGITEEDLPYAHNLVHATRSFLSEIDAEIERMAKEWKLRRMAAV